MTQLGAVDVRGVAGASGEVDDDGDAKLFGQQDRLAANLAVFLGAGRDRDAARFRGSSAR